MGQMVDSLKQKFKELHNKKVSTGNLMCPPDVARAKHLRHQIIDNMDGTDLNDEDDDDKEDEEDHDINFLNGGGSNILSQGGEEKEDNGDGEIVGGVSMQSSFMASSASGAASVWLASSCRQNKHPPTHMTAMSRPRAHQNNSPESPGSGDRIGSMMAIMMMNQSANQDERWEERVERCEEFLLQLKMKQQQMQQQQNLFTMMLLNMSGGDGNLLAISSGQQQKCKVVIVHDRSGGGDNGNKGGEVKNNDG